MSGHSSSWLGRCNGAGVAEVVSVLAILSVLFALPAMAACNAPSDAKAASMGSRQPALSWAAVEGATSYRVKLLSRVPNGTIVASFDSVVATPSFLPPQPIAEQFAKVTVRVAALCGPETSAETVSSFVIDTTAGCVLRDLSAKLTSGKARVEWPPTTGAMAYEAKAYALDGELLSQGSTRSNQIDLDTHGRSAVINVRPVCGSGPGAARYRAIAAD